MRTGEAAEYVRLAPATLAKLRIRGEGPRYAKTGPRLVIYDRDELDRWLAERMFRSTSDYLTREQSAANNSNLAGEE